MSDSMKRRVFLGATIAGLAGFPFAVRFFRSGDDNAVAASGNKFTLYLKKYRELCGYPVREIAGPAECRLALAPIIGSKMKYASYSSTFLPKSVSDAIDGEPDSVMYREGSISVLKSDTGQTVLHGGDSESGEAYPAVSRDFSPAEILLLAQENRLVTANEKGNAVTGRLDRQAAYLYTLLEAPDALKKGDRWSCPMSRLKPYEGVRTDYGVTGFCEIAGRKTVRVHFHSVDESQLERMENEPIDSGIAAVSNISDGDAWFDLETGLLVRQRNDYTIRVTGNVPSLGGKNPDIRCTTVMQLFS